MYFLHKLLYPVYPVYLYLIKALDFLKSASICYFTYPLLPMTTVASMYCTVCVSAELSTKVYKF
jgi:hypothetical protein